MSSEVAYLPWIEKVKLQASSEDLVSLDYPNSDALQELLVSILLKTASKKMDTIQLEELPELTPEEVLEMPEEEAVAHETIKGFTDEVREFDAIIDESKEVVAEVMQRNMSAHYAATFGAQSAAASKQSNKEFQLRDIPLTDLDLKFAVCISLKS